jgi:hypothetical protein
VPFLSAYSTNIYNILDGIAVLTLLLRCYGQEYIARTIFNNYLIHPTQAEERIPPSLRLT